MKFLKMFFAALLAFIVGNVVIFLATIMVFASFAAMFSEEHVVVDSGTVLQIDLVDPITDSPLKSPFESIDFNTMKLRKSLSLLNALSAIERAATDKNIEGIYLNIKGGASMSTAEELREAIAQFKESGKFVVSYSDVYSQGSYYLSSVADKVYLNPEGGMHWLGLASNVMFYKGTLDKLGVKAEVIRHGTFKAAVEPFINTQMSPENKLQMNTLLTDVWGVMLSDIAHSRGLDSAALSTYASDLSIVTANDALRLGMVDGLLYTDQVNSMLSSLIDGEDEEKDTVAIKGDDKQIVAKPNDDSDLKFVSLADYSTSASAAKINTSDNKIAIIYVEGTIVDRADGEGTVSGDQIAAKLEKVRKDDDVKALVLRVNSPGGSALASEIMWREVELVRQSKPVIVSMGSVAASGGYYISCPADVIVADKFTITGSIGVFGLMFNAQEGLKDKLGITVDVAKTNPSADMFTPFRGLTTPEKNAMLKSVERVYTTFVEHVAEGRNLTVETVDNIGQGRVWSGVRAAEIGLTDGYGGLKQAIALAADRAGVAGDFRIYTVSDKEDPFTALLASLGGVKSSIMRSELDDMFVHYKNVQRIIDQHSGVQAWMPYQIDIY